MTPAIALTLALMLTGAPPSADPAGPQDAAQQGEPLPPGAPTDSYELSAWCFGALDEYLAIYPRIVPDLKDMDHMFGTDVVEDQPYHADMAAAHDELKMIAGSVTDAEKASPRPISERGLAAIKQGRAIWSVAESKTRRELARAWMLWALPDRCDSNAKELTQRSLLFGRALNYNTASAPTPATAPSPEAVLNGTGPAAAPPAATDPAATPSDTSAPAATQQPTPSSDTAPAAPARDPAIPPYPDATPDQPKAAAPQP
ncbi:MAG TPA: hypothetical protein VMT68_02000 [Caulobacteraceae bacterium]|nr:hypothetical protein [Caulobacteraceae bacterium]